MQFIKSYAKTNLFVLKTPEGFYQFVCFVLLKQTDTTTRQEKQVLLLCLSHSPPLSHS